LRELERSLIPKCYKGIDDFPVYNWNKVTKTGNLSFLFIEHGAQIHIERKTPAKRELKVLNKIWKRIFAEYIEEFGFSDEFKDIIQLRAKIAKMRCRKIISGDNGFDMLIKVEEQRLASMMNQSGGAEFEDVAAMVKKYQGYDFNLRTISVREFFSIIRSMKKQAPKKTAVR